MIYKVVFLFLSVFIFTACNSTDEQIDLSEEKVDSPSELDDNIAVENNIEVIDLGDGNYSFTIKEPGTYILAERERNADIINLENNEVENISANSFSYLPFIFIGLFIVTLLFLFKFFKRRY